MMKCVGTGGLCSLLRHREQNALVGDQYCGYTATYLGPLRLVLRTRQAKKDRWLSTFPCLVPWLPRTQFHVLQVTRCCDTKTVMVTVNHNATWNNVQILNIRTGQFQSDLKINNNNCANNRNWLNYCRKAFNCSAGLLSANRTTNVKWICVNSD